MDFSVLLWSNIVRLLFLIMFWVPSSINLNIPLSWKIRRLIRRALIRYLNKRNCLIFILIFQSTCITMKLSRLNFKSCVILQVCNISALTTRVLQLSVQVIHGRFFFHQLRSIIKSLVYITCVYLFLSTIKRRSFSVYYFILNSHKFVKIVNTFSQKNTSLVVNWFGQFLKQLPQSRDFIIIIFSFYARVLELKKEEHFFVKRSYQLNNSEPARSCHQKENAKIGI